MLRSAHCQLPDRPLQLGAGGLGLSLLWQPAGQVPKWRVVGMALGDAEWPGTSSYQFGLSPMLAASEEVTSPPSRLSLEGSWFRPPHICMA